MYPVISIPLAITKYRNRIIASEHSEFFSQGKIIRFFRKHTYNRLHSVVTLTKQGKEEFSNIKLERFRKDRDNYSRNYNELNNDLNVSRVIM